jgi:hypothetical protein
MPRRLFVLPIPAPASAPRLARAALLLAALPALAAGQMVFEPLVITAPGSFHDHALGDVDGDGDADLLASADSLAGTGAPRVRLGDGAGHFGPWIAVNAPGVTAHAVALADLDADGALDLLAGSSAINPGALWVLRGQGDGSFGAPEAYAGSNAGLISSLQIRTADADGDGDVDVIATKAALIQGPFVFPSAVRLLLNDGTGALTTTMIAPAFAGEDVQAAYAGQFNGDEFPDLVLSSQTGSQGAARVLTGTAGGGFVTAQTLSGLRVRQLADVDADGDMDLLSQSDPGFDSVQVHAGDGSGLFAAGAVTPLGSVTFGIDFADFDGDGLLDLVAEFNGAFQTLGVARFRAGDGLGGFAAPGVPFTTTTGSSTSAPHSADIDGDGRLDLVVLVDSQPSLGVALNRSYTEAEPLTDLGFALAGTKGYPVQIVSGQFGAGDPFSFTLHGAPAGGATYHFVGATQIFVPFKGGVVVPAPHAITGPWIADANGKLVLAGHWPAGVPAGATLTLQFWFPDAGGPVGFAASSAVAISF